MKLYVNAAAVPGDGSREHPFARIGDAAAAARPGDEVIVAPGVYREYVDPRNAGREDARIVYRSEVPLGARITGAEPLKGWEPYEGTTWVRRVKNSLFGDYNPYIQAVEGDWYFAKEVRHTGAVYLNDKMLYECVTLAECLAGEVYAPSWEPEASIYKGYTEQDGDETVLYANFQGKDPNAENVEINVRRRCFFPSRTGVSYITFSGFFVDKAATTWAPPASFQDGMVGAHWSKCWIIEDCEIVNSKCCGISLGKYRDPDNDQYFFHKHVKSPTQMERDAVCRGQYHGWLKENVGSHIVRRCNIHHCEQTGIVGRQGAVFSVIEDNHIHHINNMQQLGGAEIAGIKFHAAIDVLFRHNHIHHCTMGIWCDWEAQGTRITGNLLHDNYRPDCAAPHRGGMMSQDIFVEVGHGPTLIDNNLLLSKASLRIATEGVACVHNLMLGAFTSVGVGTDMFVNGKNQPRYTPYHFPHRTEVAGFMTILHGDDRFYNNIFVQNWPVEAAADDDNGEVGTAVWDEYPSFEEWIANFDFTKNPDMGALESVHFSHLPVWAAGNAYLNGAKAWSKETEKLLGPDEAFFRLTEKDGKTRLETNIYELLGDFRAKPVDTELLGRAFEPEQPYESADGSPIVFDRDYLGAARDASPLPGPFAAYDADAVLFTKLAIEN